MNENSNNSGDIPELGIENKNGTVATYMTTVEAAQYLHKSTSWLLRQPGLPYLPGRPNVYKKSDLDRWFEREKFRPKVA